MINLTERRKHASDIYDQGRESVINYIIELELKIEMLDERLKKLESGLHMDSHNSSLPPSGDVMNHHFPKNIKEKSRRPTGGQKGHSGSTLKRSSAPDTIIVHQVHKCTECGSSLKKVEPTGCDIRQVIDIPPIQLTVTEHQTEKKVCPNCGITTQALFPEGITRPVQYGINIKSIGLYLMNYQLLTSRRTKEAFEDLFRVSISEGSLFNWVDEFTKGLEPATESIKAHIIEQPVVHFDETGIKCNNHLKWLHVAGTTDATYLVAHPKRGIIAMDDIGILPLFKGTAIHDMWASYFRYDINHGICNAHIIWELTFACEEYGQKWAEQLKELLLKMNIVVKRSQERGKTALNNRTLRRYEQLFDKIVSKGLRNNPRVTGPPNVRGRVKQSKVRNLLDRLRDYRKSVLAFLHDFRVPFTNNLAERDLRMTKVKQKISGCFRSDSGGDRYAVIRSYLSTTRKNGIIAFDAISNALNGFPFKFNPNYAE
ncbi:MAG: IS66 family transposase [Ignavibacteria bacterium]